MSQSTAEARPEIVTTVAAAPKPVTVQSELERLKPQMAMVLPKHITPDRMVRIALTACQNNPKLLQADRKSFFAAIMRSAQLGLEPDGVLGQAYLIPFDKSIQDANGNWTKETQVQFIPGYKGLIDLARRSGDVTNIIAKEVCKNDKFKIAWHETPPFLHEQPATGDRGEVIGFWAMAHFKDGGYHWDYLSKEEIEAIRNQSSGWQSAVKFKKEKDSPWHKHFIEMGKKTAIRRIAKYLPMSVQKAVVIDEMEERGQSFHENEFGDIVIDENGEVLQASVSDMPKKGNDGAKETLRKKKQANDPVSEIKESKEAEPFVAKQIPMRGRKDDSTQPDYESWESEWSALVAAAPDYESLISLNKKNTHLLQQMQDRAPESFRRCKELFEEREIVLQ